jgi:hypothetical protein
MRNAVNPEKLAYLARQLGAPLGSPSATAP